MDRRLRTGILARGRKAPQVDAASTQNPLAAVRQPEPRSAGLFSNEDRQVRESRAAPSQLPESQPVERQPLLAVRTGPAPVESLQVNVEQLLRATLSEHATLRRVGEVLSIERPTGEHEAKVRLAEVGSGEAAAELELPGEGETVSPEAASTAAAALGPGRLVSTANLGAQIGLETREDLIVAQREERQNDAEPTRRQEDETTSSAVASHTGAVQNRDDPQRLELPGEGSDPATAAVAEAAFTQAGSVQAVTQDQIVTRFFEQAPPSEDHGPEPRPQNTLGERNVPFSTFA